MATESDDTIGGLPVTKMSDMDFNFNLLIFGQYGSGKTKLAASASEVKDMSPVLFIDLEEGTLSLKRSYPNLKVVQVKSFQHLNGIYNDLSRGKGGFKTVVVDPLSVAQKMSLRLIMEEDMRKEPEKYDPDAAAIRQYLRNTEQIKKLVWHFKHLPMNTIFTSLSYSEKNDKTGKTEEELDMTNKLAKTIGADFDAVLYLYVKEVKEERHRMLLTDSTSSVKAKDRTGTLPLVVEDPTMQKLYDYIVKGD